METSTKRRIDTPDVAKMLRRTLRAEFLGTKFSVRSRRYAGGCSIDVNYTDGPKQQDVQEVCDRYCGASFDGMVDLKSYHDSLLATDEGAEVVHFAADFIFAHRSISDEWRSELEREVAEFTGRPFEADANYEDASTHPQYEGLLSGPPANGWNYGRDLVHRLAWQRNRS